MAGKISAESMFLRLANALTRSGYSDFFNTLVLELGSVLDVEYVLIANTVENPMKARTLALMARGELLDNISYDLKGSPCETVPERESCAYEGGILERFPDDHLLVELGVQSYIGMPLLTSDGRKLGILVAMSTEVTQFDDLAHEVMRIAAAQVGSELERSSQQEQIQALTYRDSLTGLTNRRGLHEQLLKQTPEAIFLADIRRFKTINDVYTSAVGDEVLRAVAERLQQYIGSETILARVSSDEFAILPSSADLAAKVADGLSLLEQGEAYARQIALWFESPVIIDNNEFHLDFTIGCAGQTSLANDQDKALTGAELLRRASVALADAKARQHGYAFFNSSMISAMEYRQLLFERFRKALREQNFQLYFQPVFSLKDRKLVGAEALCRWYDDEFGWISPLDFIAIAETRGLMQNLGDWVVTAACQQLLAWDSDGTPLPGKLAINISNKQIESHDTIQRFEQLTQGVDRNRLLLELTETAMMRAPELNLKRIRQLHEAGFSWAIDDFGTGYSSLSYLTQLKAAVLKIDRSFVSKIEHSQHDETIIQAIIVMAKALQMDLIAEGIESEAQLEYLIKSGCHDGQGFLLGRPVPADEFAQNWLSPTRKN
ncbi:MAG: EAL domain-containing protein [Aliidiomarina sp.]|uniref:putative bifunctional diguanylate cyclase/phosphodiesterase n=1 Tax=Aliidiomarina sp. TaxID=1872439 RepID=UPI0025BAE3C1|nr:sensor domain-containing phosphodiesterase [Aliidiomarina sp.]MCH8501102.1 EAL domain-containing protein [Aliidiomarina sp.]